MATYNSINNETKEADFTARKATAAAVVSCGAAQSDDTNAASGARVFAQTGGASGGDPHLYLNVSGQTTWGVGIKNSDDDTLQMRYGVSGGFSAGTEMWRMSRTGERTMVLQPAFLASMASDVTNVTGAATIYQVIFDTEIFDQNADFNLGTSTYTAPVTGKYLFSYKVQIIGCTIATICNTWITTTDRSYLSQFSRAASADAFNITTTSLCDMDAGDTAIFRVQCQGEAADTDDVSGGAAKQTYVSGCLIC